MNDSFIISDCPETIQELGYLFHQQNHEEKKSFLPWAFLLWHLAISLRHFSIYIMQLLPYLDHLVMIFFQNFG